MPRHDQHGRRAECQKLIGPYRAAWQECRQSHDDLHCDPVAERSSCLCFAPRSDLVGPGGRRKVIDIALLCTESHAREISALRRWPVRRDLNLTDKSIKCSNIYFDENQRVANVDLSAASPSRMQQGIGQPGIGKAPMREKMMHDAKRRTRQALWMASVEIIRVDRYPVAEQIERTMAAFLGKNLDRGPLLCAQTTHFPGLLRRGATKQPINMCFEDLGRQLHPAGTNQYRIRRPRCFS